MRKNDGESVAILGNIHAGITALADAAKSRNYCETLAVETWVFPPDGIISRQWAVDYRSVAVTAFSTTEKVTVSSSAPAESAPTTGAGTAVLAPGKCGVFNVAGRALTLYGKPGENVTISVFAKPQPPAWA